MTLILATVFFTRVDEMSHPHNESDFSKVICFAHNLTHEHGIFFSDEITENRTHVISKFFVLASLFKAHF